MRSRGASLFAPTVLLIDAAPPALLTDAAPALLIDAAPAGVVTVSSIVPIDPATNLTSLLSGERERNLAFTVFGRNLQCELVRIVDTREE
jgi:hypothetical protein